MSEIQPHSNPERTRAHATLADAARQAHGWGWSLLPMRGKKPAVKKWQSEPRLSLDDLIISLKQKSVNGIGVVLGTASGGLVVRDFDRPEAYARWSAMFKDAAARLPTAKTPHGYHVYCRCPDERKTTRFSDGELRCEGSLVVMPPSGSGRYSWVLAPQVPIPAMSPDAACLNQDWGTIEQLEQLEQFEQAEQSEAVARRLTARRPIKTFDDILAVSLPTSPRNNNACEVIFARAVLSWEKHNGRSMTDEEFEDLCDRWITAVDELGFARHDYEVYMEELLLARKNIVLPLGHDRLTDVFLAAESAPIPVLAEKRLKSDRAKRLAVLFQQMQRLVGAGKPFYLSCHMIVTRFAPCRGCDTKSVHFLIQSLVRKGLVECVNRGRAWSEGNRTGKAARFRYLGALESEITAQQNASGPVD